MLLLVILSVIVVILFVLYGIHLKYKRTATPYIPHISGIPLIGSLQFFWKRYDFVRQNHQKYGEIYSFKLLHHTVYCVMGDAVRVEYFQAPNTTFNMIEGYRILFSGAPSDKDIRKQTTEESDAVVVEFKRNITRILSKNRLEATVPEFYKDIISMSKDWGVEGGLTSIDPFESLYSIVFQLSIRALSAVEIANDPKRAKKLTEHYWDLERSSGVLPTLFPWIPSEAVKRRNSAGAGLYNMIAEIIDDRAKTGKKENDALQNLIDLGKKQR